MKLVVAIAMGGALGAVARHYATAQVAHLLGSGFPFGTLTVNVLGSFVMGVLVEVMALTWSPSLELRAFMTVGALGAFTTFSTFSLDFALLFERGALGSALLYALLSVLLSVTALFAGLAVMRAALT